MNRLFSVAFKRVLKSLSVEEIKPEKINSILQSNNIKPVGDFILHRLPKQQTLQLLKMPCPIQNVTSEQNKQIRRVSKSLRASQKVQEERVCNQCPHKGTCQEFAKPGQPSNTDCVSDLLQFLQAVNQKVALDDQIPYRRVMHGYKACDSIIAMIEDLKQGGTESLQYQKIRQQRILLKQQEQKAQKNQILKKVQKPPEIINKRIKRQAKKQLQKQIKQEQQQPTIKNSSNAKQKPIKMKQQNLNVSKRRKIKQQVQQQQDFQMFEEEQEPIRQKRGQKYNRFQQQEQQQEEEPRQMRRGNKNQSLNRTRIENAPKQRNNYDERQRNYQSNQAKRSRSSNDFKHDNNRRYQQNRPNFRQQQYQQERPARRQRQKAQYGKNSGNSNNIRNKQPNTPRRNTNKAKESDDFESKFQKAGQIYRNTKIFESWQQQDDQPQQKTRKQKPLNRNPKQQISQPSKPVSAQPRENESISAKSTEGTGQSTSTRRRGRNIRR